MAVSGVFAGVLGGKSRENSGKIAGIFFPNRQMLQILGFGAPGKANLSGTLGPHCRDLVPTFRAGCFLKSTVPAFSSFSEKCGGLGRSHFGRLRCSSLECWHAWTHCSSAEISQGSRDVGRAQRELTARARQKGDSNKWEKPVPAKICGFSAVSCENLRFPAVFCANLRLPKPLDLQSEPKISENLQKSAKMCVPGPVSPFCCLPFQGFWRALITARA